MATAAQVQRSKEYETIYILRSDVDADSAEKVQSRVAEVVEREAGRLVKVESWGRRKLAYPIAKHKKGVYVYVKYVGKGGLVSEMERNLKLADAVIKYQTVLLREAVDVAALQIDPEEIKLGRLELPAEAEEAESREKALGLIDLGPDAPRSRRVEDDYADDEFEPDAEQAAAAAAAAAKKEEPEGEPS